MAGREGISIALDAEGKSWGGAFADLAVGACRPAGVSGGQWVRGLLCPEVVRNSGRQRLNVGGPV